MSPAQSVPTLYQTKIESILRLCPSAAYIGEVVYIPARANVYIPVNVNFVFSYPCNSINCPVASESFKSWGNTHHTKGSIHPVCTPPRSSSRYYPSGLRRWGHPQRGRCHYRHCQRYHCRSWRKQDPNQIPPKWQVFSYAFAPPPSMSQNPFSFFFLMYTNSMAETV